MSSFFFPDNTALINFQILDRWDLLAAIVTDKGQWCGSVAGECADSTGEYYHGMYAAAEEIFGSPVIPEPTEHVNARVLRANMADPTDDWPTKHLGEAETIAVVTSRFQGSRFITDDAGAQEFAQAEGIKCYGTGDLLVVAEKKLQLITASQREAMLSILVAKSRMVRYFQFPA